MAQSHASEDEECKRVAPNPVTLCQWVAKETDAQQTPCISFKGVTKYHRSAGATLYTQIKLFGHGASDAYSTLSGAGALGRLAAACGAGWEARIVEPLQLPGSLSATKKRVASGSAEEERAGRRSRFNL